MTKRAKMNRQALLLIALIITVYGCKQNSDEISTPQADAYDELGISDSLVKDVVELKGLYRLQPEDKSLEVDIKVDFKDGNNSEWITNIGGNEDRIPKKFRVFGDALYVTHDLEEFDRVIADQRAKGNDLTADVAEEMVSNIPMVDKYRIEVTETDTIRLMGSRVNFSLVKIQ